MYIYHWLVFCTLWINRNYMYMHCKLSSFTTGYNYIKFSHPSVSNIKLSCFSQTIFGKGLIKVELFFHSLLSYPLTRYIHLLFHSGLQGLLNCWVGSGSRGRLSDTVHSLWQAGCTGWKQGDFSWWLGSGNDV